MEQTMVKTIAEELKAYFSDATEATAVTIVEDETAVEIHPAETNTCNSFFHMERLTDYTRYKGLSSFAMCIQVEGKHVTAIRIC